MNISDGQLPKAIEFCSKVFKPIRGQFQENGVIKFQPIQHLGAFLV
jgi:hypothetical protein